MNGGEMSTSFQEVLVLQPDQSILFDGRLPGRNRYRRENIREIKYNF